MYIILTLCPTHHRRPRLLPRNRLPRGPLPSSAHYSHLSSFPLLPDSNRSWGRFFGPTP